MAVGIIGSGPAAAAVESALEDVDVATESIEVDGVPTVEIAVVIGGTGETVFERANERALAEDTRWVAVELGGVGGIPIVDAAVSGFAPDSGCYECLSGRVSANLDPQAEPAAAPDPHTARFAGAVAGREVARSVTDDVDISGRVVVVPFDEREFLPLPNCVCEGKRTPTLERDWVERSVDESLGRAERAIDDRFGLVAEVGEAESFPVPYYLAHASDTAGFSDVTAARDAAGVDADWNAAFMKAVGEALERYCAGVYRTDEFETGRPSEMPDGVHPAAFVCESDPASESIEWVIGENLLTDDTVFVPAEFVHYPPPSKRYRSPITTGLGLGNSTVEALLAGLYEVIERDAMMLSWYSTFEPLALDLDGGTFEIIADRARAESLELTPLLLTQDVDVPVVAVAAHREEWPRLAFGTGAHLDVSRAAGSAAAEAIQNWMELRGMGEDEAPSAAGAIGQYAGLPDNVAEFIDAETTVPAASVGPETVPTGVDHLYAVLDRIADADLDAYGVDLTTRDVESIGFEVVRAVIPSAQPLFLGAGYFGDRARTVPDTLGFEPRLDRDHHPFP